MDNKNKPYHSITNTNNRQIIITEKDLPLSCPQKNINQVSWDDHPIIYLPIKEQKLIICPYCKTEYIFAETSSII